jgi:hypothetical protein
LGVIKSKKKTSKFPGDGVKEVKGKVMCDVQEEIVLPNGPTRFWLCGDMKEFDFVVCGGGQGCGIPFNR